MRRLLVVRRLGRREATIAAVLLATAAASGFAGYMLAGGPPDQTAQAERGGRRVLYWYDPMYPDRHFPRPGKSPFMDMPLVAKYADEAEGGGVIVSPAMQQNLGIRLARVDTRDIAPVVRAVGRIEFDERQLYEVQTLTPGFVERLSVRAEGEPIGAGRVVAQVYSPELLAAQNEYRALLQSRSQAAASLRDSARSRLRLLGMPDGMIRRLKRGGSPQRTYPVVARASGVVTRIGARPGSQVGLGDSIITIQGLGQVLVIADVPEASLAGVRRGQPAEISFPAYPDEIRRGVVDYIFPALNTDTRTARVRITLANPGLRLRQGMFANVTLQGTGGMAVVVPSEAVIDTGRRRVVIVKRNGAFVPAEVTIGRDAGDYTQILSGLRPGEEVVASGQFLIDSEASLSGVVARLQASQPAAAQLATTRGTIQSIDPANGQVTIQHEAVTEVGWPAMTMTFKVARPAMLRGLRRGLRVEFAFTAQPQDGSYIIQSIRPEPPR